MSEQTRKYGWYFGPFASIIWIPILAVFLILNQNTIATIAAVMFFVLGVSYIIEYAPWKYQNEPFWKIYLGLALIIIVAAVSLIYFWNPEKIGLLQRLQTTALLLPLFLPIFIFRKKTWNQMYKRKP